MANKILDTSGIAGWAVDADPTNDPTYPIRETSGDEDSGMNWARPPIQPQRNEVLRSVEHPRQPAVFGTSAPPSGLSGIIRRRAFKHSESEWSHWMMLLAADRVNVVEGFAQDLGRGRIPNIPAEMGMRSEIRHNPRGFAKKLAITASVVALAYFASRWLIRKGASR